LHFVRVGRFGFSFFWSRKPRALSAAQKRELREARREANMALLRGTAGAKPLLPIDWSEPQYQFDLPKVTSGGNR
jgi:hypothetical protein